MVEIQINNLWKRFPDGTCIGPIEFQVEDGEMIALLGPSGSGKTTTLRMVAGFIKPDKGRILFNKEDVTYLPPNERRIGMVVQSVALFPNMNVFQNIAFGLDVRNWIQEEVIHRVEELADMLGIRNLLHRRINAISGGEGQRVALARALAPNPELLLLDEPLSALDPNLRENLQNEIRKIQQELEISTIYVTHNQEEAFAIADRIAILENGIVSQIGSPSDLYDRPRNKFVASFIGRGSTVEAVVTQRDGNRIEVEIGDQRIWISGNEVVHKHLSISIKPEDISISKSKSGAITGEVQSVTPQPGRYRVQLEVGRQTLYTYVSSNTLPDSIKPGNTIYILIDPDEVTILSES
ncbi:MAG: ABC transporter ATP-binding protein [Candidatus Thorarchaeota archaeon]